MPAPASQPASCSATKAFLFSPSSPSPIYRFCRHNFSLSRCYSVFTEQAAHTPKQFISRHLNSASPRLFSLSKLPLSLTTPSINLYQSICQSVHPSLPPSVLPGFYKVHCSSSFSLPFLLLWTLSQLCHCLSDSWPDHIATCSLFSVQLAPLRDSFSVHPPSAAHSVLHHFLPLFIHFGFLSFPLMCRISPRSSPFLFYWLSYPQGPGQWLTHSWCTEICCRMSYMSSLFNNFLSFGPADRWHLSWKLGLWPFLRKLPLSSGLPSCTRKSVPAHPLFFVDIQICTMLSLGIFVSSSSVFLYLWVGALVHFVLL